MKLGLQKLQEANNEAPRLSQQKANSYKEINKIFYY